jgi:hypothetical protein
MEGATWSAWRILTAIFSAFWTVENSSSVVRGSVDFVPDPLLLRKSGSSWICSQELWSLDHRGGLVLTVQVKITSPDKRYQTILCRQLIIIYLPFGDGGDSVTRQIPEHLVCGETLSNIAMVPDKRKASSIGMQRCNFCRLMQCNEIRLSL